MLNLVMHKVNNNGIDSQIPSIKENELVLLENCKKDFDNKYSLLDGKIEENREDIENDIRKTVLSAENVIQELKKMSLKLLGNERTRETYEGYSDYITFKEDQNGILNIILPELFPKRYRKGNPQNNLDYLRSNFIGSFNKYFEKHSYKITERAVIIYRSHYSCENNMIDYDNFDYKILTDLITEHVLIDDNPKRILSISDYVMDSSDYSEIILIPYSKAGEYVIPIFLKD